MEVNSLEIKDGDIAQPPLDAPSVAQLPKQKLEGTAKKKRRRGKSKRKMLKPYVKVSWQDRRKNDKTKRNNRFRKIVLAKTHAPFNNNQFLMEIHKPEPENNFHTLRTPSARTRDSSFSVDSEENYFYSLPEDEEAYLTKEFSSVYEDAQSERLSNMSKDDLIQEYLLLEAKFDNLVKRTERSKLRCIEDEKDITVIEKDTSVTDKEIMVTDRDTSETSIESSAADDCSFEDIMQRLKEQEDQIRELQLANEKLILENEHLRQRSRESSSEDSESDSSSTSGSSSSSRSNSPVDVPITEVNGHSTNEDPMINGQNEVTDNVEPIYPLVNGFHNPSDENPSKN